MRFLLMSLITLLVVGGVAAYLYGGLAKYGYPAPGGMKTISLPDIKTQVQGGVSARDAEQQRLMEEIEGQ
jgi:hypothetical protein